MAISHVIAAVGATMNQRRSGITKTLFIGVSFWTMFLGFNEVQSKPDQIINHKVLLSLAEEQVVGPIPKGPLFFKKGKRIQVILNGILYFPPIKIPLNPQKTKDRTTPEEALTMDHYANLKNEPKLILAGWMPNEHKALRDMMNDPNIRKRNHDSVAKVRSMELYGKIYYKKYVFMLIGNNGHKRPIGLVFTMQKFGKNWLLTNQLQKDPMLNFIWVAHNIPKAIQRIK